MRICAFQPREGGAFVGDVHQKDAAAQILRKRRPINAIETCSISDQRILEQLWHRRIKSATSAVAHSTSASGTPRALTRRRPAFTFHHAARTPCPSPPCWASPRHALCPRLARLGHASIRHTPLPALSPVLARLPQNRYSHVSQGQGQPSDQAARRLLRAARRHRRDASCIRVNAVAVALAVAHLRVL